MLTKFLFRLWPSFGVALLLVSQASGYDLIRNDAGQTVTWDAGSIAMQIKLGTTPTLIDGTNYSTSVQAAMQTWNANIQTVQFVPQIVATGVAGSQNGINEIAFDSTVYGQAFDANVLAVTMYSYTARSNGTSRVTQADIIFNSAFTWNSYRGALQPSKDIRRVALHELGHVFGLDHPDQASPPQSVIAVMNSTESSVDSLTADDIAGAQSLYGAPISAPSVTAHPANQSVYTSQTAQFNIVATGNPAPTFRWQRKPNGGSTWSDLSDAGSYSGSTAAILSVTAAVLSMSGDQFRCVVTNGSGSATSNAASLTVTATAIPVITSQPLSQTVLEGNPVTFSAAASGVPSPSFQWRKGTVDIAGANSSSYTIPAVLATDAGSYTVVASNLAGSVSSNGALLTVNIPPVISSLSPTRQVLTIGQSLNLNVTATGTGLLSYQWIHNGRAVAGSTNSNLTIPSTVTSDGGWYVVLVTDTKGTRRSPPIFVIVKSSAASTHVVGWGDNSFGQVNIPTALTNAISVAAGEDASLALKADGSVVGWGKNTYGQTSVPVGLSNVVAVALGAFHAVALKADGTVVSWGDTSYGLSSTAASLSNIVAVSAGFYYSMALKADGTVVSWGDPSSSYNQTNVPAGLNNVVAIAGNNVSSLALKSDGKVVAWGHNSLGQTNVPAGLTNVVAVATGSSHTLALKADGTVVAWGDNVYGQTAVPSGLSSVIAISAHGIVSFALKEDGTVVSWGNDSSSPFTSPQSQIPYGLTGVREITVGWKHALALCSGPVVSPAFTLHPVSKTVTSGSEISFSVAVSGTAPFIFRWQRSLSGTNSWTDVGAGGSSAALLIATPTLAMNGDRFRCIVSNTAGSVTSNVAMLTVTSGAGAPVITAQPLPATVSAGQSAVLSVIAKGSIGLTYRWQSYHDESNTWSNVGNLEVFIPGAYPATLLYNGESTASLQINTGVALNGGLVLTGKKFRCFVTNNEGNAMSNEAILIVLPSPSFATQPLSQSVFAGGAVTIVGVANGYPAPTYQWRRDGVDIVGATSASLTLTNIQTTDAGNYILVATNSSGAVTSSPAVLTVLPRVGVSAVLLGDFGGDGKADLIWTNTQTGERSMWFLNGNTTSGGASLGVVPVDWVVSVTADFDGDGKADIFWTNTMTGDRAIWLMNGSSMRTNTFMGTVSPEWVISGTGDFNGDGKADVVWTNTATGDRAMWLMNGATVSGGGYLGTVPVAWAISGVGDFNGDGKADLVWSNQGTGERSMWFQNGSTTIAGSTLNTVPAAWVINGVGDFNGDGKSDIFLTNTTTGDRVIWLMNGSTIATNAFMGTVPVEWTISGTGDFNGDEKKDLFWTNTATGDRAMWLLNGSTVTGGGFMGTVPSVWKINN